MFTSDRSYRLKSYIVDLLICLLGLFLVLILFVPNKVIGFIFDNSIEIGLYELIQVAEAGLYAEIFLVLYLCVVPFLSKGQTLGMKLFKIRCVRMDEKNCTFGNFFIREIVCKGVMYLLSFGIYIIVDGIILLSRDDKLSLSDIIAKTKIVDKLDY